MQVKTGLCRLLGIEYPVILAGMAGGPSGPELAAAVSAAGGLGTIGAAYLAPEAIRGAIRAVRSLTDRPFAVNLFAPAAPLGSLAEQPGAQTVLNRLRQEIGLGPAVIPASLPASRFAEQFAVLLEEKVPVVSTAFGVLPERQMREAHAGGMKVIAMITSVREAGLAEAQGVDAIVAQGTEAGGHRGTFDVSAEPLGCNIGTFALVPQVTDRVRIPVIAAGGVMDGRGLAAALMLGAQGVQLGTRFLAARESGAHPAYQQALMEGTEESTEITTVFSGRPARSMRNRFTEVWREERTQPYPYPLQNALTREIRNAAAAKYDPQYMSLWAGQGLRMLHAGEAAGDIVRAIVASAAALLTGE